jgi:hypothetical protein
MTMIIQKYCCGKIDRISVLRKMMNDDKLNADRSR